MNKATIFVDDIQQMVRIYTKPFGRWAWFRFDEFKRNLHFWQEHPRFTMSRIRREI